MPQILPAGDHASIAAALVALRSGHILALPTDTVYGIAALVNSERGVRRLYEAKGRDLGKAIPILIADASQLAGIATDFPSIARKLAARFWPGALTIVLPKARAVPDLVAAGPTVAVRIPANEMTLRLLRATGPLAVTSANRSGAPDSLSAGEVVAQLGEALQLVLDAGRAAGAKPSTIVDVTGQDLKLIRQGPIPWDEILAALNQAPEETY